MERDHGKSVHKSCDMVHVAWGETMEKVYINHVTWYMLQDQRTSCEYLTKTNVIGNMKCAENRTIEDASGMY